MKALWPVVENIRKGMPFSRYLTPFLSTYLISNTWWANFIARYISINTLDKNILLLFERLWNYTIFFFFPPYRHDDIYAKILIENCKGKKVSVQFSKGADLSNCRKLYGNKELLLHISSTVYDTLDSIFLNNALTIKGKFIFLHNFLSNFSPWYANAINLLRIILILLKCTDN